MVEAFVGIGSNLNNRHHNIERALDYIRLEKNIIVEKVSSIIETEPEGGPPQGKYLNNRHHNIKRALDYISLEKNIIIEKVSSIIETEPEGGPPQGKYLNCVIKVNTSLSARGLLKALNSIENKLGRERLIHFGPRTIDLDILIYGNETIEEPGLKIPHPRMFKRRFVMGPLLEIEPGLMSLVAEHKLYPVSCKEDNLEA